MNIDMSMLKPELRGKIAIGATPAAAIILDRGAMASD